VLTRQFASSTRTASSVLAEAAASPCPESIGTGFALLDTSLEGGIRAQDLTVVAGRPGVGKTIAALQWAVHIARSGRLARFVCYEHTEEQLVGRVLVAELGSLASIENRGRVQQLQRFAREVVLGRRPVDAFVECDPIARMAFERFASYADRLSLVRASGMHTGLPELEEFVADQGHRGATVFVDYLQKIACPIAGTETDRVIRLAEGLKELALAHDVALVALASCDAPGLTARRTRLSDIRGSVGVAYEADVAVILNEKATAVSKVHLAFDAVRARDFRSQIVFSIEKNRGGPAPIDLEFTKDFASYRFDPNGNFVADQLVDDVLYTD